MQNKWQERQDRGEALKPNQKTIHDCLRKGEDGGTGEERGREGFCHGCCRGEEERKEGEKKALRRKGRKKIKREERNKRMKRKGEQNGAEAPPHGHPRRGAEIKERKGGAEGEGKKEMKGRKRKQKRIRKGKKN